MAMFIPRMLKNALKYGRLEGAIEFAGQIFNWRHENENRTLINDSIHIKMYTWLNLIYTYLIKWSMP